MMYVGMARLYPILSPRCSVLASVRLIAVAALLLFAAAAPARAATMQALKPCYVSDGDAPNQREKIAVHAAGFTPEAALTLKIDNQAVANGTADAFGAANAEVPAPFQGFGQRAFTLTVVEDQNPDNFATQTSLVTNLAVILRPQRARPARRVRFSGRGFTLTAPVYGHYVFGGEVRRTVRLAPASGLPCGTFHARRRQIPVRRPATGRWILQVDQQREYAPRPATNAQRVIIRVREMV
jgi:hypothetical protein